MFDKECTDITMYTIYTVKQKSDKTDTPDNRRIVALRGKIPPSLRCMPSDTAGFSITDSVFLLRFTWFVYYKQYTNTSSSVVKRSMVQEIIHKQRSNEDSDLKCDLDLQHNNPIFIQYTPGYDEVPSN